MTDTTGALRADDERCAVRFERLYDAAAEELWAALTEPEQLCGWLAAAPRFDARVGGEVELLFGDGSDDARVSGRIRELERPRVLEYEWRFPGEEESVVRFELVPQERGTLLVLDHRRLGRAAGAGYAAGWHAHLDALARAYALSDESWQRRYEELLPGYREQAAALGWSGGDGGDASAVSPVRDALYRGDRAAAEEAAAQQELDLFDAAALGDTARVRELLDAGADVGALSADGFTPLHLACFSGGADTVRLLVEHGAPLELLAESSFARVRPLGTAAFSRQLECARVLVDAGADANGAGEGGFVPLHTAAQNGDVELVRLLLDHGADTSRTTADGRTPADVARAAGHAEAAHLLAHPARATA